MDEKSWELLKGSTWFLAEQQEVIRYVDELRSELGVGPMECPECGKVGKSTRSLESVTEHLRPPEWGEEFEYTYQSPVYTCECGFSWSNYEHEEASTEARRVEVEKRYWALFRESKRLDREWERSLERMRTYFKEGMGLSESVGGMEAMFISMAVELTIQRKARAATREAIFGAIERVVKGTFLDEEDAIRKVMDGYVAYMGLYESMTARVDALEEKKALLEGKLQELKEENASLRSFKQGVDESLNSGDGAYRP